MSAVVNPFRYGGIVSGPHFAGREAELAALAADVRSGQNVLLAAPRRTGKSSLVAETLARVAREGVLAARIDCSSVTSEAELVEQLANAVYLGLARPLERAWRRATQMLAVIQPQVTFIVGGADHVTWTLGPGRHPHAVRTSLQAVLRLPGEIARARGRRVALVLDEFQDLPRLDPALPAVLRAAFQAQDEVAHVFLGSEEGVVRELFTTRDQAMFRLAKPMTLGPIRSDEFRSFLVSGLASAGVSVEEAAVARILSLTEGQPYYTQALASFTWLRAATARATIDPDLVMAAKGDVMRAESGLFAQMWAGLTANQRRVLVAVVADPDGASLADAWRTEHRLGSASSVQEGLAALRRRGLLQRGSPSGYAVPDPFLRQWVGSGRSTG